LIAGGLSLFLLLDRVQIEQDLRGGNQVVVQLLHQLCIFKTAIDLKLPYIGLLAWFDEAGVVLHVIDKGSGMLPEQLDAYNDAFAAVTEEEMLQGNASFGGIGLWNVHSRLRLEFGEPYGLRIVVSGTGGTIVEIKLPYREGKHDVQHPDR
jgi:K+-sensing histidine kinase KdpD